MTTRRSFLGAMLAAATAPFVISNGLARGVLMPAPRKIWLPGDDEIVPAGPLLKLYSGTPEAGGVLLAVIPLIAGAAQQSSIDLRGQGQSTQAGLRVASSSKTVPGR